MFFHFLRYKLYILLSLLNFVNLVQGFAPGTSVITSKGPKNIESIRPGDEVFTYKESGSESAIIRGVVLKVKTVKAKGCLRIDFASETSIYCSPYQELFYNSRLSQAIKIKSGDTMATFAGETIGELDIVTDVSVVELEQPLIYLFLPVTENYLISSHGYLARNTCLMTIPCDWYSDEFRNRFYEKPEPILPPGYTEPKETPKEEKKDKPPTSSKMDMKKVSDVLDEILK